MNAKMMRIKHAKSMALNIDDRLDDIEKASLAILSAWDDPTAKDTDTHICHIEKAVRLIRDRLEDLTIDLRVIREAEEAEADEARAFAGASARAEVNAIQRMLANLPEGSVIDRMSLEARLGEIQASVDQCDVEEALCDRMGIPKETPPTTPETAALARDGIICAQCYDYLDAENRPAAGPWEPYSDDLYDAIKDADGAVWAVWRLGPTAERKLGYAYTRRSGPLMDNVTTVWETSSGRNLYPLLSPWMRRNPDYIARVIPPQEAE